MTEPKSLISDVSQALEGNQKSYRAIYDYLAPILRKTIKRKVYGIQTQLAQDILQDVFVKLFSNLHSYRNGRSFTSWAISIAVHHVIDLSRKRKLEVVSCEIIENYASEYSDSINDFYQDGTLPSVDVYNLINNHIDSNSKNIILWKYYMGLKHKQIAATLNKPIGSISGIQAHAIGELKRKISELKLERTDFR